MVSGGQTCNQEAAVQQTFSLVRRSSFFYLQQWLYGLNAVLPWLYFAYNCTKHSPTQLLSSRSEATPHEMKSSLSSCKSVWTRDRLVVFSGLQSVLKRVVDWTTRKTSSLFVFFCSYVILLRDYVHIPSSLCFLYCTLQCPYANTTLATITCRKQ